MPSRSGTGGVFAILALGGASLAFASNSDELGGAGAINGAGPLAPAVNQLLAAFPGLRVQTDEAGVVRYYGMPMTAGNTAEEAASLWLASHDDALGAANPELELAWSSELSNGRFTVFAYNQTVNGVPVEYATARVLVNNEIGRVVYAAGNLANLSAATVQRASVSPEAALDSVASTVNYAHLPMWSDPTEVVYMGQTTRVAPRLAWKFVGEDPTLESRERYTFFVDAATGALLDVRNDILNTDVSGQVNGKATPGALPDKTTNLPTVQPMPIIRVAITGGNSAYTNVGGAYNITNSGSTAVTVTTNLDNGLYADVNNTAGSVLSLSQSVTPPGPGNFEYNSAPSEFNTAQVNAFIWTTKTRNFFADRAPGFPGMSYKMPANVNLTSTCNAFFDGSTINFYRSGGGCVNTAYSSVVAHEYGHYVVQALGLSQGSFGEGFGDCCSIMLLDDVIIGRDFCGTNCIVRDPDGDNVQYPCGGEIHYCGEVLADVWWEIRVGLGDLAAAQQMFVDWSAATTGGSGNNSAHPGTAIEILTIDDDNGNIADGTPNYGIICNAFAEHNIDCPEISLLDFVYPNGLPAIVSPTDPSSIRVDVVGLSLDPQPGTGSVSYRVDGGGWTTIPMNVVGTNQYEAAIPAQACGAQIDYFFLALTTTSVVVYDPQNAPASFYSAVTATGTVIPFSDTFETNQGWTVGDTGDNATTGLWNRMDPQPTAAQPGDDVTASPGVNCWVTDGNAGGSLGDFDVDSGKTTLKSPVIDLSSAADAKISYWRWYSNDTGAAPNADTFVVDISNNGGTSWVNVETVGPTGIETSGGWYYHEFWVSDETTPTATMRMRFIAQDQGSGSLVEAAIDDFTITVYECSVPDCPTDLNDDGVTDLDDLSIMLVNFGGAGPFDPSDGDLDNDDDVDLDDLSALLVAFGQSCP